MTEFRSLVVSRHARVGIAGDLHSATEAWLVLHGYGMLAQGILHWFRGAERPGRVLVAPEGLSRFYTEMREGTRTVGASWTTREDLQQELEDQFHYLERAVHGLLPEGIPLQVHGFSQGVSVGSRWSVRTSRPISRLVCWAGAVPEDVTADGLRQALGGEPLHLVIGTRDSRVVPARIEADALRYREAGLVVTVHRFDGGHWVDEGILRSFSG
ncbi:MAG: alpha/beta hydrolase [Gemmatimonadales bacterium]